MADTPLIDRSALKGDFSSFVFPDINNIPLQTPNLQLPEVGGEPTPSAISAVENKIFSTPYNDSGKLTGGGIDRTLAEASSNRYDNYVPNYNNEDAYAQGQSWANKMVNGLGKGLSLAGTTFLQSTAGSVYGIAKWNQDGRAASFYDNEFNRKLDEWNKQLEDSLPNYYTDVEKNANWYSPDKLVSANFFWDGIIKNMGFAAGAAGAGVIYGAGVKALSSLPLVSRLFSVGKAAEALAATEASLLAGDKAFSSYGKVKALSDKFLGAYNTLNTAQRVLVAGLATTGEAGFEAYHNLNDFRNQKIEEYKNINGYSPSGEDLEAINRESDNVGNTSFQLNTALLTATNYIQFPKILGSSYSLEKGILNTTTREIGELTKDATGKFIEKQGKRKFLSTLNKVRPYTFSISEGFEEGAQFAITKGVDDYYNKQYLGEETNIEDSIFEGISQTIGTNEGMENILIGGLSGALMMGRGRYLQNKQKSINTGEAIAKFNDYNLTPFTKETVKSVVRGVKLQEDRARALRQGDILETKDLEQDYIINYLTPRIKYGRYDLVESDVNEYKKLASTDEGFSQLQAEGKALPGDTRASYLQRLSNLLETANSMKTMYQSIILRYGNQVDKQGKPVYSEDIVNKMIYAATKVADYDKRIPQLTDSLIQRGIQVYEMLPSVVEGGEVRYKESLAQINKLDSIDKDELKEQLKDVRELSLRRQMFLDEYNQLKNSPEKFKTVVPIIEDITEEDYKKLETIGSKAELTEEDKIFIQKYPKTYNTVLDKLYTSSKFQEGRTYKTESDLGTASVHKLSDDEYQVRMGNSIVDNFSSEEEAEAERDNINIYRKGLSTLRIIKINKDGSVKAELPSGDITTLTPKQIAQYELLETEEEKKARKEIEDLQKAEIVRTKLKATFTTEKQNNIDDKVYQPEKKKDDNAVINGTVAKDGGKPHQIRANTFGINLSTFKNREKLRAIDLTSKTDTKASIPGLVQYLVDNADVKNIDPNTVIVTVFVQETSKGKFSFVDENGIIITKTGQELIDSAIFQVRPLEKLTSDFSKEQNGSDVQSMFRDITSEDKQKELRAQYAAYRKALLASDKVPTPVEFTASFGILEYEQKSDSKGNLINDFFAKNSVEEIGLVDKNDLIEQKLLDIPTTSDEISENGVKFTNALGRVFLRLTGVGLVKLNNSAIGKNRAETVFDVINQVAKNIQEDKDKGVDKSKPLFDWLRSIVYWGIPKNLQTNERKEPSLNSIWFEDNELGQSVLKVSNHDKQFMFTPSALQDNKVEIISLIQDMYHNTSATELRKWAEYKEIEGINKDGDPVYGKTWPNYQSYLVAKEGRKPADIPLTTPILAIKGTNKQNRKGIYFVLNNKLEKVQAEPTPKKEAPKSVEKPKEQPSNILVVNIPKIAGEEIGDVPFIKNGDIITFPSEDGKIINPNIRKAIKALMDKLNITPEAAQEKLASVVNTLYKPQASTKIEETIKGPFKLTDKKYNLPKDQILRQQVIDELRKFEGENWKEVENWLEKNFPNIPVYRVKNVIEATNGRQAWGMLHNGAIYITKNAETGTAYHEVFEAVWKMFTPESEQTSIFNEFKGRKGSFTNRFTGENITYSKATDLDIKEELAEEFKDYILDQKKPEGNFISRLFRDLWNFIKSFFTGENSQANTKALFEKIGNGYYKTYIPYETNLVFAKTGIIDIDNASGDINSEFSLIPLPYTQLHEVMQQMTYDTLRDIIGNNESLFTVEAKNKKELYDDLKDRVLSLDDENPGIFHRKELTINELYQDGSITQEQAQFQLSKLNDLFNKVNDSWDAIVDQHSTYLRQFNIEFDENDDLTVNNEDKDKGSDGYGDSRKVDSFRKSNPAIKMLFATLPVLQYEDESIGFKRNTIGGVSTVPMETAFITVKNKVYNAVNIEDMLDKLREFALENINYRPLYERLTKSSTEAESIDWSNLKNEHDLQLLSAFWKSMKAQNADVKIVFILPSGEVEISDAHLANAARQSKYELFNDVVGSFKKGNKYIDYNKKDKEFNANGLIKNLKLDSGNIKSYTNFLKTIGIEFPDVPKRHQKAFEEAVNGIKLGIASISKIKDVNKYSLDLEGRLSALAAVKAAIENPEFESTYFNVSGERTQTYIGTNLVSNLYDYITKVDNINDLAGTQFEYLLSDKFSKNSVILNYIFNPETGNKIKGREEILKTGIAEGIVNQAKGKNKESSNMTSKERLVLDLNMNAEGWFLNLVPGDASIEWMVKMHTERNPWVKSSSIETNDWSGVYDLFKNHLISEIEVSKESRNIVKVSDRKSTDLRFFKTILSKELHDKIVKSKKSPEQTYIDNKSAIDKLVKEFIEEKANNRLLHLQQFGIIEESEEGLEAENLSIAPKGITKEKLLINLKALEANYILANIELHKLIYSDPYFYNDELKRIKNFNSPGQSLVSSINVNNTYQEVYNKDFKKESVGYTNFVRPYLRSSVSQDIKAVIDLKEYDSWDETDGGGIITMKANRNIRIRAGEWNENEEKQYIHDIKYQELVESGANKEEIESFEKNNPAITSAYTPLKPIVRGPKDDGKDYNDVTLDKFALVPYSFRILHILNPTSNALKHYKKMEKEDVDYTVFKSGRKVGAGELTPIYNQDGSYNIESFNEINNIPFSIIDIQTEVPSKDKPQVTQGSQVTKLVTMDFMDAGVPLDYESGKKLEDRIISWTKLSETQREKTSPLYKLIKYNETLLIEKIKHGYDTLLNRLGLSSTTDGFIISDKEKLATTLTDEIFKRDINTNIVDAFEGFKSGDVVLEATPAYQQIRYILYSIANKQVVRPTISGGMKVQIPSSMLESTRVEESTINGKKGFNSDILKFYENKDGERICEIMVGRWFNSDLSDDELLKYLNNTKEGQKILSGIGFRIPTQKQNSIDSFRIKQFLPKEFGDSVVIPSALVKKVGSDFDIDKLSVYLKNTYTDLKGKIKLVPFFGYGQKAKDKFSEMYDEGEFLSSKDRNLVNKWIKNRKLEDRDEVTDKLFTSIFGKKAYEDSYVQEVMDDLLDSKNNQEFKDKVINEKYKQSLENEYIQSMEDLVSHPLNFEKLITPNSADQLKDLSKNIVKKLGFEETDYSSVGNMLDRNFMDRLRNAFVRGKYAIGIAATSQTNNAQNQRSIISIDIEKLKDQPEADKKWLGDGIIKFDKYNKVENKPTLSISKNQEGQLISDLIGMFIDGYVDISKGPWIMELGATPNTAGTWLFLIKLGVPIETVAYFMNQPIIRDYMRNLENEGYVYIFNDTLQKALKAKYNSSVQIDKKNIPSKSSLEKTVGKEELSDKEKAEQLFILDEFFKYAKLAEQLFHVQQGSNFDTATINDPFIAFKKELQLEKARTTMIDSVDKILDSSFVGELKNKFFDIRNAYSAVLISDKPGVIRDTLQRVLTPYINENDRDFIKISQKAVADLFDWAVQTNPNNALNVKLQSILLGNEDRDTAGEEIIDFVNMVKRDENHPLFNNYIIKSIKPKVDSVTDNKPYNLYIDNKGNKTYNQNNTIYGFNELKDYLFNQGNIALYNKLVDLAVLQSGLSSSPISFTQLLPYQDFQKIYNQTLQNLEKIPNLEAFADLNVFERNNWNNPDIVVAKKSKWMKLKVPFVDYITGFEKKWIKIPEIEFLPKNLTRAMKNKQIPQVIQLSPMSEAGRENFLSFTWENPITADRKKEMRKKGDYSYINKGLFQKVFDSNGNPLITTYTSKKGNVSINHIYKLINAWGDSFRANEFYTLPEQSKIDNNLLKVNEVSDIVIEKTLYPDKKKKVEVEKGTTEIPDCV